MPALDSKKRAIDVSAVLSYMRTTDEALNEIAHGLRERSVDVGLVLCHSGEREADRAAAVWPDAVTATHGVNFAKVQAAEADFLQGLSADVLAQALPIAERSIGLFGDVNVSHLVQAVAAQHRRARLLVAEAKPKLGLFLARPERLLDFFVHLNLKETDVPCIYPRIGPASDCIMFSVSRDAPLLAAHNQLAPETIRLQRKDAETGVFTAHSIGGSGIRDVISRPAATMRWSRTLVTKTRARWWLRQKGCRLSASSRSGPIVAYHLHLEPEATTYPANGFRSNQLNNIALLSEWVGGHGQVVVKEHPVMLARRTSLPYAVRNRTRTFYEAVRRLPNVVLLDPADTAEHRVEDADIVATVGGNVGWEALKAGVPVVHFGQAGYENAVGAHRWTSHLLLDEILRASSSEIAEAAQESIQLLVQHAHADRNPNRRVGRVRALLAALDELAAHSIDGAAVGGNGGSR